MIGHFVGIVLIQAALGGPVTLDAAFWKQTASMSETEFRRAYAGRRVDGRCKLISLVRTIGRKQCQAELLCDGGIVVANMAKQTQSEVSVIDREIDDQGTPTNRARAVWITGRVGMIMVRKGMPHVIIDDATVGLLADSVNAQRTLEEWEEIRRRAAKKTVTSR